MNYVFHVCKNRYGIPGILEPCNNGWIDKDITKVKDLPPHWKYCRECCKKLGIDFDKQTPKSNASLKQKEAYDKGKDNLK